MESRLLTDEEIKARLDEYWELCRDLWNEGGILEADYESGFDYWTLEAQDAMTVSLIIERVKGIEAKIAKEIYIAGATAGNASREIAEREWAGGDILDLEDYYRAASVALQAMIKELEK